MIKHLNISLCACMLLIIASCGTPKNTTTQNNTGNAQTTAVAQSNANYQVVPMPKEINNKAGEPFVLTSAVKIIYPAGNDKMKKNADFLAEYLHQLVGFKPEVTTTKPQNNFIALNNHLKKENKDAYEITIDNQSIVINGASEAGNFYGIQTLRKATPIVQGNVAYAPVTIKDEPRYGYRGMMLDVSRHFQPVAFVKKYIDILALHNINKFHWHLTEDQGWRIEIKKYPRLTEIGSKRSETVIGRNTGKFDGIPHGGFYTQDEIRDIVSYAEDRHITIIPEIDLPGHMLAALASYPELGCTGGPYEVEKTWGVFDDILCAGQEKTFTFLEGVLSEVIELFPSKLIHIGGDEAPKVRWEKCPRCQAKIKELGIKGDAKHAKEFYLQSYVTERVEKYLIKHGRNIIGWDEILEGKLAPNATVMSWRGIGGGIEAAQLGHNVIMTPTSHLYFDYYQTTDTENEPLGIGGYVPLKQVYSFEPEPDVLTAAQKKHILGPQANLWTEYIKTSSHVEYMVMPRIAALSEVQWLNAFQKNYDEFLQRLPRLINMYNRLGYTYATHVFDVQTELVSDSDKGALAVTFNTIDDAPVYYTLDGSEPTINSNKYNGTFYIKDNAALKAVAIRKEGSNSRVYKQDIKTSKATFKPTKLLTKPAKGYEYTGASTLVDGLYGTTTNYKTGRWIGFQGNDLEAVIDMQQPTQISNALVRNCVVTGDWIMDAEEIIIESSADGNMFTKVYAEKINEKNKSHYSDIVTHKLSFAPVTARYYKVTVKSVKSMPDWHAGKGKPAYIFVDEIALN